MSNTYIWGASSGRLDAYKTMRHCGVDIKNIKAIIDRNSELHGSFVDGYQIVSPTIFNKMTQFLLEACMHSIFIINAKLKMLSVLC